MNRIAIKSLSFGAATLVIGAAGFSVGLRRDALRPENDRGSVRHASDRSACGLFGRPLHGRGASAM